MYFWFHRQFWTRLGIMDKVLVFCFDDNPKNLCSLFSHLTTLIFPSNRVSIIPVVSERYKDQQTTLAAVLAAEMINPAPS